MRIDDELPLMVWTARPDLACDYVSRAWLDFTGYGAAQALGHGWSRALHPEDLAHWLDACVRAFDTRQPFSLEYRLRRRDGEYRWMLDRAAPLQREGAFVGFCGVCVDIDERKSAHRELARSLERERRLRLAVEEASRAKDAFLGAVLNELQAPTRATAACASHLRGRLEGMSEAGRALEAIERNARLQNRIIADLQQLAPPGQAPLAHALEEPLLSGVRVLVVEDDVDARERLLDVLRVAGAQIRATASGAEALEVLQQWRPDIVLSALGMHGGDYLLIHAVRSRHRPGAARCDAQLAKPVEPVALLATMARLVQPVSS